MGSRSGLLSSLSNACAAKNPKLRNCPQKFGQENSRDDLGTNKKSTSFRAVAAKQGEVSAEGEVEDMRKELWEYAMEESYERLIDRLVGTRVKFRVTCAQDRVREYIAVLKEYNDKHMYLMDVKRPDDLGYEDEWSNTTLDIASNNVNVRDERGMRSRIEEDHLILENNAPYEI